MRSSLTLAALSCLAIGCARAEAGGDTAADLRAWQGTWRLTSCTYDGGPQPGDIAWVVKGGDYFIRQDRKPGNDPYAFRLDATKGRVDVKHHDTPPGTYGGSYKGIYKVGRDRLKVCYDLTGRTYPASFDAPGGSRRVLYEFTKE